MMNQIDPAHLTLAERTVLAFIADHPTCSNHRLAELVGMSLRGIEALLRRMILRGYLRSYRKGRARRLELTFPVEHHIPCGDLECAKPHTNCGNQLAVINPPGNPQPELPLAEAFEQTMRTIDQIVHEPGWSPETPYRLIQSLITRVENDWADCPEKQAVLDHLIWRRDGFYAVCYCARNLPKQYHRQATRFLLKASPDHLAQLRQRIETGQLAGNDSPRLLVHCVSNTGPGPGSAKGFPKPQSHTISSPKTQTNE